MSSLLPNTATALEKNLDQTINIAINLPIEIRTLWNHKTCSAHLLPYLAWALSVDRWDEEWPISVKRDVIARSFEIHKIKGTMAAVKSAVEPMGYKASVNEWWQKSPEGVPGTISISVSVENVGITETMYSEVARMIDDVKPISRHLVGLDIMLQSSGKAHVSATNFSGDVTTIYPYMPTEKVISGRCRTGGSVHIIDQLTIY